MKQLIIFILFCICYFLPAHACHVSCNSCQTNKCLGCIDANSSMDSFQRSCICNLGYYTGSLQPFQCLPLVNYNSNGNKIALQVQSCAMEMGLKVSLIKVSQVANIVKINDIQYVQIYVTLDLVSISITQECQQQFITQLYIQNPNTLSYDNLSSQYFSSGELGTKIILIKLIDFYSLAVEQFKQGNTLSQIVKFGLNIGNESNFYRNHKFSITLCTNQNVSKAMALDIVQQAASMNCLQNQLCITIPNIDANIQICQDQACVQPKQNPSYQVGQMVYAQVSFIDPTSTKQLVFKNLYFKDDNNIIYDLTQVTTAVWANQILSISFQVPTPSLQAIVQIKMEIQNSRLRQLLEFQNNIVQQQIGLKVVNSTVSQTLAQQILAHSSHDILTQKNNSIHILFYFKYLILLILSF